MGCAGAILHLTILGTLFVGLHVAFAVAQAVASVVAMVLNFTFNNSFTHRDQRLTGRKFLFGLASFIGVCSVGAFVNVEIAQLFLPAFGVVVDQRTIRCFDWLGLELYRVSHVGLAEKIAHRPRHRFNLKRTRLLAAGRIRFPRSISEAKTVPQGTPTQRQALVEIGSD